MPAAISAVNGVGNGHAVNGVSSALHTPAKQLANNANLKSNILARLHGPRDIRIVSCFPLSFALLPTRTASLTPLCYQETDTQHPAPGPGEATIQILATGTCGSDLHYYLHGANGNFKLQHPMCLGHESAGIIVALPPSHANGVENGDAQGPQLKVGDRVALEAGMPCRNVQGDCGRCAEGRYNLCPQMRFASSAKTFPHLDGTLRKYMNWPIWLLHKWVLFDLYHEKRLLTRSPPYSRRIPNNVSMLSASLIEPLSVVLQGFQRARFCESLSSPASHLQLLPPPLNTSQTQEGESILVLGAGAVGLLACVAAKAKGASFVAAVDIDDGRLAFAKRMGWADAVYKLPLSLPPQSAANGNADKVNGSASTAPADEKARRKVEDEASVSAAQAQASLLLSHFFPSPTTNGTTNGQAAKPNPEAGFDLVFECTGVPSCVQAGIFATRPGGRIALIGMGHPVQSAFPIGAAALREVDIIGVFRYANIYPVAIDMLSSGAIVQRSEGQSADAGLSNGSGHAAMGGLENLVSHRFSLEETAKAFETMRNGKSEDGKGVIKVFIVDEELLASDDQLRSA
jgi:L-iditol 2-dehydrogenase